MAVIARMHEVNLQIAERDGCIVVETCDRGFMGRRGRVHVKLSRRAARRLAKHLIRHLGIDGRKP